MTNSKDVDPREIFCLYAKPSFLEGVARLVDVFGFLNQYNTSETADEADIKATGSDWSTVGYCIVDAVDEFEADFHGRK